VVSSPDLWNDRKKIMERLTSSKTPFFNDLIHKGPRYFVENCRGGFDLLNVQDQEIPLSVNAREYENSYITSPYTGIISYTLEHLSTLKNPALRISISSFLKLFGAILKVGEINQVIEVNNYFLSICLYFHLEEANVSKLTLELKSLFPKHAILYRSLNSYCDSKLLNELARDGYLILPTRKTLIFDPIQKPLYKNRNNRTDKKALDLLPYQIVGHTHFVSTDYPRMKELYRRIYIEKYSQHNPIYEEAFFKTTHLSGLIQYRGLRDKAGELVAFIGFFIQGGKMTVPLFGYDPEITSNPSLYRALFQLAIEEAQERNLVFNAGSGAFEFKKARGGVAVNEYSALHVRHLSKKRRIVYKVLQFVLTRFVGPTSFEGQA
jgi:hypothetical protein